MSNSEHTFSLGVIMLNTHFPRVLGDIGNPDSFDFDVVYQRVPSATVSAIVSANGVDPATKQDIFARLTQLEQQGIDLIVTTCGFLGEMQQELKAHTRTPVLTSSLLTIPFARNFLSNADEQIGVLTFDANKLNEKHFGGHFAADIVIGDIPKDGELYQTIQQDRPTLDTAKAEAEVVTAAQALVAAHPNIKVLILECTNLSPYRAALVKALGLPTFDIIQAIEWFKQSKVMANA
ncbi:aspartate/glutamate racemase family protein [Marinomonas ostreistagni]|uniref:aspartate/glutamate racemase family protein n=1 Tax=Marinomonas ostreistagni TaxID=359209 RepID=UPI00194FDA3E|nr:aspartate/glutamate racemase family protein [Marinomonas ostreistagni]MBM6550828.1 hypothetical protein [Marinomonas ostreistagni]